jgi:hypothetical protein
MQRKIAVLVVSMLTAGLLQFGMAAPASAAEACQDPNCPWSPVTEYVYDTLWWVQRNCDMTLGPIFDPNPCP